MAIRLVKQGFSIVSTRPGGRSPSMPAGYAPELIAAAATPAAPDGSCLGALHLRHLEDLLARGCDGIALFGTTGEGPAFTTAERRKGLERALDAGIAPERLVVAAMSAAPGDTLELCRHAANAGVTRLLVMPPFFFRGAASPDGLLRFYGDLVEALGDDSLRILLYHFPDMSGAEITADLVLDLRRRFGDVIDGVKDSAGDLEASLALIRALPDMRVLVGTEVHLPAAVAAGGKGTICGLANVAPETVRELMLATEPAEITTLTARLDALDALLSAAPFAASLKAMLALTTGEPAWALPQAPMAALDAEATRRLENGLRQGGWLPEA